MYDLFYTRLAFFLSIGIGEGHIRKQLTSSDIETGFLLRLYSANLSDGLCRRGHRARGF